MNVTSADRDCFPIEFNRVRQRLTGRTFRTMLTPTVKLKAVGPGSSKVAFIKSHATVDLLGISRGERTLGASGPATNHVRLPRLR